MAKKGRPAAYSKAIGRQICERIAAGESLNKICQTKGYPGKSTVFRWLLDEKLKDFWELYAQARELQIDGIEDEIFDIADDGSNDWMERELDNGKVIEVVNHEHINRSRLRVDTRKWYLGKVRAKKYGENGQQQTVNLNLPALVETEVTAAPDKE